MLSNIAAKNFMSWKDLSFNIKSGATLVDGWNDDDGRSEGSGKSAILNALCWNIYGKLPKDVNVDDVIKDGESTCSVVTNFDNGDSIVRSRKPNELYLMKAGAMIKGKDARETQTIIEEYIGCNFETFCQSVYFAQNYDKKFLSSNQEDKGKILSSIQNLQIFDKARKETMDLLKLEESKITKLKSQLQVEENNFSNFTSQRSLVQSFIQDKIQKHQQQVSQLNQQLSLISGHIKNTEASIEATHSQMGLYDLESLAQDELELNQAKSQYVTQLSGVTYQKGQIDSVKKAIQLKENEGNSLASKYKSLESRIQLSKTTESARTRSLQMNRSYLTDLSQNQTRNRLLAKLKQLQDFVTNPTKICPSCGTELKSADTSHSIKEIQAIQLEISELESTVQKQIKDIDVQLQAEEDNKLAEQGNMVQELSLVLSQLQSVSEYLDQNKVPSVDDLTSQENEIKGVIKQIDDALFNTNQKKLAQNSLINQLNSLTSQLGMYNQQHSQISQSITNLGQPDVSQDQAKLMSIEAELNNVQVRLGELRQLLDASVIHTQRLETLKDGFKEIKSYVFTNALNELNFRTNQYLNDLFEMEATIKFTNDDQKIESKITLDGKERSLGLLSGGQSRRFNLAVDLALSDIVSYRKTSKLDLLIFDEYFKDLSEISMEKSLDLLKSRKSPVILIEHNSIFKSVIENTFFVRLENGTSHESRQ